MNIKILSLTFCALLSTNLLAANHLLLIGGGGEPERDYTIFDTGVETFGKNLKGANWKYQVSFNGGHTKTEAILRQGYTSPIKPTTNFSAKAYEDLLKDYKARILSGDIENGDQLMIIVDSHGAEQAGSLKTHKISGSGSAKDLNSLAGSELINLDTLEEIVQLTNERGIKLGIVDLSCHSGNTLALKNANTPNTCIIAATGPVHYGFAGPTAFTDKFLLNLKSGTNLEEAFLQARTQSSDASYPMISTPIGDEIVSDVYKAITPYLYYRNATTDKMTPYILANATPHLICQKDEEFKNLIAQIDQLQSIIKKPSASLDTLKILLSDYKKAQDSVLKASMALDRIELTTKENFSAYKTAKQVSFFKTEYTWKELLTLDVDKSIADYEKYVQFSEKPKDIADNKKALEFLKAIKVQKEKVIALNAAKDYVAQTKELISKMGETRVLAGKIATQERVFFDELYRNKKSKSPGNACSNIVF